ncbi:hypothetical protein [Microbulbifer agarilyticus]|uniref:hypothetical protein n=1 Tax=Microbulbifer agarilyticus TaxID=260552 RepID=UPI001CD7A503|nr:hypothetical protein [Microbulbifer agarilyticus]MCA0892617.1 hypothetical protein [Microbulbifer agarilyticus]
MGKKYLYKSWRRAFGHMFALVFALVSLGIVVSTVVSAIVSIFEGEGVSSATNIAYILVNTATNFVVALTIFELAYLIDLELAVPPGSEPSVTEILQRDLPRFIGTIICAVALEGLILILKYNTEQAYDRIYIAVAVILSAALLLVALALYLKWFPLGKMLDNHKAP